MLVKMAEAIGRVVLAGRELTRLAGFVLFVYYVLFKLLPVIVMCLSSFRHGFPSCIFSHVVTCFRSLFLG